VPVEVLPIPLNRTLIICSSCEPLDAVVQQLSGPFVAMVPAFDQDNKLIGQVVAKLIEYGCVEICCVGPHSETLHDSIDYAVEDEAAFEIITTWHEDLSEGCEYFLNVAGGKASRLLALIGEQAELRGMVLKMVRSLCAALP